MQLWNDYEGKTIAEVYSLGALVRPEGRSALFNVADGPQGPAIIRLTEALNDENETLACWGHAAEVQHENLLKIRDFGQTDFEGTPLTYAVMEPTDANLADLLKERPLSFAETMQVATSLVKALNALHANGLIHEHVYAINVLAAGETVKLRTDCVRECEVDRENGKSAEFLDLIQRDVRDLSTLLLQALTLEKTLNPTAILPAPFDRIVPNGMNGTWGLAEISNELNPKADKRSISETIVETSFAAPLPEPRASQSSFNQPRRQESATTPAAHDFDQHRVVNSTVPLRSVRWAAAVAVVILLLALSLHFFKRSDPIKPQAIAPAASQPQLSSQAADKDVAPAPQSQVPESAQPAGATRLAIAAHTAPGWYVVAYTYNREDQAWRRAAAIMKEHPSLNPQVIAPSGHAPFLITMGGAMTREEAESMRKLARHTGMPRDTFVRNYEGS